MACIPPTLEGWVYIDPIHGPLYTWAQYTPTTRSIPYQSPAEGSKPVTTS